MRLQGIFLRSIFQTCRICRVCNSFCLQFLLDLLNRFARSSCSPWWPVLAWGYLDLQRLRLCICNVKKYEVRVILIKMAHRLDAFAEHESDVTVRQQLACSAARFPAHQAMPMINANVN